MFSMTGYGRGSVSSDGRSFTIELKSVNNRYLDLSMRLPRHIQFLEDIIRKQLSDSLCRGHVDIFVNYLNTRNDSKTILINKELLKSYADAAHALNQDLKLHDNLGLAEVLQLPDVTEIVTADEDQEALISLCHEATTIAIEGLRSMRLSEGNRLKDDLKEKIGTVSSLAEKIATYAPNVVKDYQKKLTDRLELALSDPEIDRARLATEIALFADHACIDEEITRLRSHIKQMLILFDEQEPVGRRMDFVVQEMNREFNTIGSKANDANLTNLVLSGKSEIEKIREQIQNVE